MGQTEECQVGQVTESLGDLTAQQDVCQSQCKGCTIALFITDVQRLSYVSKMLLQNTQTPSLLTRATEQERWRLNHKPLEFTHPPP